MTDSDLKLANGLKAKIDAINEMFGLINDPRPGYTKDCYWFRLVHRRRKKLIGRGDKGYCGISEELDIDPDVYDEIVEVFIRKRDRWQSELDKFVRR